VTPARLPPRAAALRIVMRGCRRFARPLLLCAFAVAAVAAAPDGARAAQSAVPGEATRPDPVSAARLLDLDPESLSANDVATVLAGVPAPRIVLLQGSFAPVTMEPFARFLIAMGYPEDRIRNPRDGAYSASSFADSGQLAGTLAWYYENDGVRPLVIGHSQGGMLAIRALHELAGAFTDAIPVWNPMTDAAERRTAIVDPLSGALRPVVGLQLPYVAAIATGKLMRILLGQWTMIPRLRRIPDSVEEFTGFAIEWDPIAGQFPGAEPYAATGVATVRNVTLPVSYTHIGLPQAEQLAANAVTRAWIDAYAPGASGTAPLPAGVDTTNLIHAADIWHSVKKHWCSEARRLAVAQQGPR
jgi:hypothetical protein